MDDHFGSAVRFVLAREGGYSNDPDDPGGETKYGICKRFYPHLDIKNLTRAEAEAIYKTDYWDRVGCPALPWPTDLIVFDTAVNHGVSFAASVADSSPVDILFKRLARYTDIVGRRPASAKFLRGWVNRILLLRSRALEEP